MTRYEVVLRYDYGRPHEYVFARTRRLAGAEKEAAKMVAMTRANMIEHAHEARVVEGPTGIPGEYAVVTLHASGDQGKTVLYREVAGPDVDWADDRYAEKRERIH